MKKYFGIILIEILFRPTGESTMDSQKFSWTGLIEIEDKEDKPSIIFYKMLKKAMVGWENSTVIRKTIEFFNFWEEKEISMDFMDIPIDDWDISAGLMSELKKLHVRNYKDIHAFGDDVIPLHLGKKSLMELKGFLKTKGVKFPKW